MGMLREDLLRRRLTWDEAKGLGGETFEVFPDEATDDAVPMAIVSATNANSAPHMIQFSLEIRGPAAPRLPQGMYRFRHARLGEYAFVITAIGASPEGTDYQACFSHAP
jgi:hypothetical protein